MPLVSQAATVAPLAKQAAEMGDEVLEPVPGGHRYPKPVQGAGEPVPAGQRDLAGHWVQIADAGALYSPAAHRFAVDVTLPEGHAYPAVQLPEQLADVSPDTPP